MGDCVLVAEEGCRGSIDKRVVDELRDVGKGGGCCAGWRDAARAFCAKWLCVQIFLEGDGYAAYVVEIEPRKCVVNVFHGCCFRCADGVELYPVEFECVCIYNGLDHACWFLEEDVKCGNRVLCEAWYLSGRCLCRWCENGWDLVRGNLACKFFHKSRRKMCKKTIDSCCECNASGFSEQLRWRAEAGDDGCDVHGSGKITCGVVLSGKTGFPTNLVGGFQGSVISSMISSMISSVISSVLLL